MLHVSSWVTFEQSQYHGTVDEYLVLNFRKSALRLMPPTSEVTTYILTSPKLPL